MDYKLSLHSLMFLSLIFQIGFQLLMLGMVSKLFYEVRSTRMLIFLRFNYSIVIFILLFIIFLYFINPLFSIFFDNNYSLPSELGYESYYAITGINLLSLGTTIFVYSLLYNLIFITREHVDKK